MTWLKRSLCFRPVALNMSLLPLMRTTPAHRADLPRFPWKKSLQSFRECFLYLGVVKKTPTLRIIESDLFGSGWSHKSSLAMSAWVWPFMPRPWRLVTPTSCSHQKPSKIAVPEARTTSDTSDRCTNFFSKTTNIRSTSFSEYLPLLPPLHW